MDFDRTQVEKALMQLATEKALQEMGKRVFKEVGIRLYEKHECYFSDCLEHPEYIKNVLQEMFGNASRVIIDSIRNNLEEFSDNRSISNFLVQLK